MAAHTYPSRDVLRWGTLCTKYIGEPSSRDEISPSKNSDADAGTAEYVGAPEKSGQLVREKAHQRGNVIVKSYLPSF